MRETLFIHEFEKEVRHEIASFVRNNRSDYMNFERLLEKFDKVLERFTRKRALKEGIQFSFVMQPDLSEIGLYKDELDTLCYFAEYGFGFESDTKFSYSMIFEFYLVEKDPPFDDVLDLLYAEDVMPIGMFAKLI